MKFCQMTRLSAAVLAVMLLLTACTGKSGGKETEAYTDGASEPITETNDTDLPATATPETKPDDPDDVTQPDESAAGTVPSEQDTEPETEPVPAPTGLFDDPTHLSGFLQETNQPFLSASGCGISYNADGSVTLTGTWKKGTAIAPALTVSYARMMQTCWDGFTETDALPNGGDDRYYAVVFTVRMDATVAGNSTLSFSSGQITAPAGEVPALVEAKGTGDVEHIIFDLRYLDFDRSHLNTLRLQWAEGTGSAENLGASLTVLSIDLYHTVADAMQATGASAGEDHSGQKLNISSDRLDESMQPVLDGTVVSNETVMFIDAGDERALLYRIDRILSVTSYDGSKTYVEGQDYELRDGRIVALAGGAIPCITSARYYGADASSLLVTNHNGKNVFTYWGEGRAMTDWQVCVTYTHTDTWDGFIQPCEQGVYERLIGKLQRGEDVTVMFYGDSITYGASSSYAYNYAPYRITYPMMLTQALADLFGYTVHYVSTDLSGTCAVPTQDYVAGTNGTITYINTSVGGWNSADAVSHCDQYVMPFVSAYGCDLFIMAFGGNDAAQEPKQTCAHMQAVCDRLLEQVPDVSLLLVSTMVPNPNAVNGWYGNQYRQEPHLLRAASAYRASGVPCAVSRMTSMSLSILERIEFSDYSGNNINHPNDFFARIYAQTLFETLIGYGNLTA